MDSKLPTYRNTQVIAITAAIVFHTGLAAWAMQPQAPIVLPQQVMRVNFVSPSSTPQEQHSEITEKNTVTRTKADGLHKKKKDRKKADKKRHRKAASARQTSGKTSQNATAKHSAQTEPVFNAEYLNNPAPIYPARARKHRIQGKVLLDVFVRPDGTAKDVNIEHSSGSRVLDDSALDAVRNWRFIPAKRGHEFVEARVIVPVEFKLN